MFGGGSYYYLRQPTVVPSFLLSRGLQLSRESLHHQSDQRGNTVQVSSSVSAANTALVRSISTTETATSAPRPLRLSIGTLPSYTTSPQCIHPWMLSSASGTRALSYPGPPTVETSRSRSPFVQFRNASDVNRIERSRNLSEIGIHRTLAETW